MKIKIFITLLVLYSSLLFASDAKNEFLKRYQTVIQNRKTNLIKSLSQKLNISEDKIEKNIIFSESKYDLNFQGFLSGQFGVCEIQGKLTLIEKMATGKCISDDFKVSIIWP